MLYILFIFFNFYNWYVSQKYMSTPLDIYIYTEIQKYKISPKNQKYSHTIQKGEGGDGWCYMVNRLYL